MDDSKSFDFGNLNKYLKENGEMTIKLEGKTKARDEER